MDSGVTDQQYPGNELTDEKSGKLRDAAVDHILKFVNQESWKSERGFDDSLRKAEFALKVLDFVTG